jgi:pantetheine-phosphate adenylyltransferase
MMKRGFRRRLVFNPACEPSFHVEMPNGRTAIYPGTFDPVTNGHVDVIERAARVFDRLVVAVADNASKSPLFSVPERVELLTAVSKPYENVQITSFQGLSVDFARTAGATVLIRGLRAVSDFEYEFQMALMNRHLAPDIETVLIMTDAEKAFLSSSTVKEVARLGGNVHGLVPDEVEKALKARRP